MAALSSPVRRASVRAQPAHLGLLLATVVALGMATVAPSPLQAQATVRVTNLVAPFLAFHAEAAEAEAALRARAEEADEEPDLEAIARERLELWEAHLGESRPLLTRNPGETWEPEGLDAAWARYPDALDRIRSLEEGITPDPAGVLREVAGLLRLDRSLEVHLVLYVGTFQESSAFRLREGEYAVLVPAETLPGVRRPLLVDLLTRAVHARLSGRPADGQLSLAQHLLARGLALRVHEELTPGRPAEEYLQRPRSWLLQAEGRDGAIMDGLRPRLASRDEDLLARYLQGSGMTGLSGEFDYAAWRLSGLLLLHGWTLDRLARIPQNEVNTLVAEMLGAS